MPWSFIIPAAASLIGGSMQSRAVKKAAAAEREQQDKALQLQQRMYEEGVARHPREERECVRSSDVIHAVRGGAKAVHGHHGHADGLGAGCAKDDGKG